MDIIEDTPNTTRDEPLFEEALRNASKDNYLGDIDIVYKYLSHQIHKVMELFENTDDPSDYIMTVERIGTQTATTFLGMDAEYAEVPGWNEPGKIDEFLAAELGLAERSPKDRIKHAFSMLIDEMLNTAEYAGTPGILDEQWQFQVQGHLNEFARLFVGQSRAAQYAMMLTNEEPSTVEDE
jgi:5'-3' exonuclease